MRCQSAGLTIHFSGSLKQFLSLRAVIYHGVAIFARKENDNAKIISGSLKFSEQLEVSSCFVNPAD
ncbi:MAG: hypothetical protein J6V99_02255 [Neisseriaceae bacterium]|nr:hypothetical protein [Neisseriaceae bacterium]